MKRKIFTISAAAVLAAQCFSIGAYAESFSETLNNIAYVPGGMLDYSTMNTKERFHKRLEEMPSEMKVVMPFDVTGKTQIFVSPDGADTNDGSMEKPFKTIKRALKYVENADAFLRKQGIVIYLREGEYSVHEALSLTGKHSGGDDAPLFISSYNKENVVLTASDVIPINAFHPVTDDAVKERLYPEVRDKILEVSLPELGITNYGSVNYNDEYDRKYSAVEAQLYLDDEKMTLSRYPNNTMLQIGLPIDLGPDSSKDDYGQGFEWTMADDVPLRWKDTDEVGVYAYFSFNYWPEKKRIMSFNADTMSVRCHGRLNTDVKIRNTKENQYYFYNVLDELDVEGEYYIDRDTGKLYFYPPSYTDENSRLYLSTGSNNIFNANDIKNIVFNGITIKNSSAKGMVITNSKYVVVQNCRFIGLSGGVSMSECTNSGVTTSYFLAAAQGTETGVVAISGRRFDDPFTASLTPRNNFIQNCYLEGGKNMFGSLNISGSGCVMSHNLAIDSTHGSFRGNGSNWYFEYNESVGGDKVQGDGAPYYTGGPLASYPVCRFNYIHHPSARDTFGRGLYFDEGGSNFIAYGNIIQGGEYASFSHNGKMGVWYNNLFINNKKNAATSGNYFRQYNNWRSRAFYDHESSWYYVANRSSIDPTDYMWNKLFPEQMTYFDYIRSYQDFLNNNPTKEMGEDEKWLLDANYFYLANNISVGGKNEIAITSLDTIIDENNYDAEPKDFADFEHEDYTVVNEELLKKMPGFIQIPMEKIGLIRDCDMWRDLKMGSFKTPSYPKSGYENRISPSNIYFDWAKVSGAAFYKLMIAEDESFENVVYENLLPQPTDTVSLEPNKHYYYKIIAQSKSLVLNYEEVASDIYDFYTMTTDEANAVSKAEKQYLRAAVIKAQGVCNKIVEGTAAGEYPEGTKLDLQAYINNTMAYMEETNIQGYIDERENELYKKLFDIQKTVNTGNIISLDMSADSWEKLENPTTAGNQAKPISLENDADGNLIVNSKDETSMYIANKAAIPYGSFATAKIKIDSLESWKVFAGLAFESANYGLGTNDFYSIILSKDGNADNSIELQKYKKDDGRKDFLSVVNNGEIKENEWCEIAIGTIPYENGTRFVFIADGKVIYDYYDTFENGCYYLDSYFVHSRTRDGVQTEFAKSNLTYDEIIDIINSD